MVEKPSRHPCKKIIHGQGPAGNGRLGVGDFTTPVEGGWVLRVAVTVNTDHPVTQQVHVPDHQRASGEVVGALGRHLAFRCRAVIVLAAHLGSKLRRTAKKFHSWIWTHEITGIRPERLAVWQIYQVIVAIRTSRSFFGVTGMLTQGNINFLGGGGGFSSGHGQQDNSAVDDLGFAIGAVEFFEQGRLRGDHTPP